MPAEPEVGLRSWTDEDLPLLRGLLADPGMMTYLGGPESEEKLLERHAKYLAIDGTGTGRVFVITAGPEHTAAGWVGYWQTTWHDEPAWETGWSVLPAFQGRGLASRGAALAMDVLAGRERIGSCMPSRRSRTDLRTASAPSWVSTRSAASPWNTLPAPGWSARSGGVSCRSE